MDLKTFTAQIELMHQEALRQSVSYEDKWAQHISWRT